MDNGILASLTMEKGEDLSKADQKWSSLALPTAHPITGMNTFHQPKRVSSFRDNLDGKARILIPGRPCLTLARCLSLVVGESQTFWASVTSFGKLKELLSP